MANNNNKKQKKPEEQEQEQEQEQERKVPVFTVLKNGAILKNIFVVNKPPSISNLESITSVENEENPDQEEILIVGRHPDCNIMLTHPSISRFHLQINSNPSSQKLSVTDLSSIHGTWVSGKKIEAGVGVELIEGDTIRVGGSTRVYRLSWVPLSHAYDLENPFLSPLDLTMTQHKEEDNALLEEENALEGENTLSIETEGVVEEDSCLKEGRDAFQDENALSIECKHIEETASVVVEGEEEEKCQVMNSFPIESEHIVEEDSSMKERENAENFQGENILSIETEGIVEEDSCMEEGKYACQDENALSIECKPIEEIASVVVEGEEEEKCQVMNSFPIESEHIVEEDSSMKERENAENFQDDNSLSVEKKEIQSLDLILEGLGSLFSDDNSGLVVKKEIPSAPPMPENMETIICDDKEEDEQSRNDHEVRETQSVREALSEIKKLQVSNENKTPQSLFSWQPLFERGDQEDSTADRNLNMLVNLNSSCSVEETIHPTAEILEEAENQSLTRKYHLLREISTLSSVSLPTESVNSSKAVGKVLTDITDYKESQTPQSLFVTAGLSKAENLESSPVRSEKRSTMDSIWSRRGKPATEIQIQTGRSRQKTTGANTDAGVEQQNQENIENTSISKALFSGFEGMEEEIYTPDKENFTPNTLLLKSLKKKGKLGGIRTFKSSRSSSSNVTFSPNIQPEEDMIASSDKENETPKVLQEQKSAKLTSENQVKLQQEMMVMKRRAAERMPFQSLVVNSAGKSRSEASVPNAATRSSNSVYCSQTLEKRITCSSSNNSVGEGKRSWTMVADTASLLDKESRKSLQLLQGLKGTQLIIPRMVIRELDCLKRRGSIFRRTTEASLVLDWIEDCMIKTNWWIHVQSSGEEEKPIAPTPPASPRSQFSEGNEGFLCGSTSSVPFSARGSLMDIVTPTAEDHILDSALLFRKMKNDGQLVLLSYDVTLKIKAMAEGLLCETAQEFRESLVNPFSERFLWADSSPRGRTWSYLDDVVLREKYNCCPLKKSFKGEGGKGLKLILLHNSQYGQYASVS